MSDSSVSSGTSELVFSQIFFELSQILFESKNMQIAKPFFLTHIKSTSGQALGIEMNISQSLTCPYPILGP